LPLIVFDFETGGLDIEICPPIQVAAMVIDPRTLKAIPNAVFSSMMCPPEDQLPFIQDQALEKNKKTRKEISEAPPWSLVWPKFTKFVLEYKTKGKLPIPAGQNITGFDLPIARRLCKLYGPWDKKKNEPNLFNRQTIELMTLTFSWFENLPEPQSYSMDSLREYFGMSKEGAHDALQDVKDTAAILIKYLKLCRRFSPNIVFKDAFKNG
jgi:DNA polymerase III epsilon subunit-like protein